MENKREIKEVYKFTDSFTIITPALFAGKKNVYDVFRIKYKTGKTVFIGRELPLTFAREVASRESSEDGWPLPNWTKNAIVGEGVTICIGSDRYPGTIIAVSKSKKKVIVQRDNVKIVNGNAVFMPGLDNEPEAFTLRTKGRRYPAWIKSGKQGRAHLIEGKREYYMDPSF